MGFSPNELVVGHNVRGLLSFLCYSVRLPEPPKNIIDYVIGFSTLVVLGWGGC